MSVARLIIDRKDPESMPFRGEASLTVWQLTGPRLHNDTFTVRSRWHTNTAHRCIMLRHTFSETQINLAAHTCNYSQTHTSAWALAVRHTYTLIHLWCRDNTWQAESQHHADSINTYKISQAIKTPGIDSKKEVVETNICLCHVKKAAQLPHCKQKYSLSPISRNSAGFLSKPKPGGD